MIADRIGSLFPVCDLIYKDPRYFSHSCSYSSPGQSLSGHLNCLNGCSGRPVERSALLAPSVMTIPDLLVHPFMALNNYQPNGGATRRKHIAYRTGLRLATGSCKNTRAEWHTWYTWGLVTVFNGPLRPVYRKRYLYGPSSLIKFEGCRTDC